MKKIIKILAIFVFGILIPAFPNKSFAASACSDIQINMSDITFSFTLPGGNTSLSPNHEYRFSYLGGILPFNFSTDANGQVVVVITKDATTKNVVSITTNGTTNMNNDPSSLLSLTKFFNQPQNTSYNIVDRWTLIKICTGSIVVDVAVDLCTDLSISPNKTQYVAGDQISLSGKMFNKNTDIAIALKDSDNNQQAIYCATTGNDGSFSSQFTLPAGQEGQWNLDVYYAYGSSSLGICRTTSNRLCGVNFGYNTPTISAPPATYSATLICDFTDVTKRSECDLCFKKPGVYTPFGCIETNPQKFVEQILKIAIGLGGGIAFLMILYGGFVIMTSSGNPEKLNAGKEIITSAIAGLLLIVFSVVILKIIGVDIFKIPGLSK